MSLHSKFDNLLNPKISYNIDEEGNNVNSEGCQIVDALQGSEGVAGSGVRGVSKLRARNAPSLADTHDRYEFKKVKRSELEDPGAVTTDKLYDASLSKYFLEEASSSEEEGQGNKKSTKNKKQLQKKPKQKNKGKSSEKTAKNGLKEKKKIKGVNRSSSVAGDDEEMTGDADDSIIGGFSFKDDGDYSQYADEEEEDEDNDEDDDTYDESDEGHTNNSTITTDDFVMDDDSDEQHEEETTAKSNRKNKRSIGDYSTRDSGYDNENTDEDSEDEDNEDSEDEDNEDSDDDNQDSEEELSSAGEGENSDADDGGGNVKAVELGNLSVDRQKAAAVTKQLDLYDKLYTSRINMQKVVTGSLHLPQPDTYVAFQQRKGEDSKYATCLTGATAAATGLINSLLSLQEAVLKMHPDTKSIAVADSAPKPLVDDEDEEITSSEDESDEGERKKEESSGGGVKRKRSAAGELEAVEEVLAKRHCSMTPYRDSVVAFWEERTRLLQAHSKGKGGGGGSFAGFEEGFAVMVRRALADRERLLKRTQLRSVMRGNLTTPLGGKEEAVQEQQIDEDLDIPIAQNLTERYDPEIYDDRDFYSRYLEELLKMKLQRGTSKLTNAQFIDMTQKLRKQNKKVVDNRRSKGRKLKYDVVSSMLQFHYLCPDQEMDEQKNDAISAQVFKQRTAAPAPAAASAR